MGLLELRATNTHLYVGARLETGLPAPELAASPRGLRIRFRDGVDVSAELLQNEAAELAIDVPAYRTRAGTEIPAKAWRVSVSVAGTGSVITVTGRI